MFRAQKKGKVMKWGDTVINKAKYKFFLPNVVSKVE